MRELTIKIQRYLPEQAEKPFFQEYTLSVNEQDSLLKVLRHIKDEHDSSLSFRWSCQMAVCGSCSAMVNGKPELLCSVFIKDYKSSTITVEPLAHFPIVRDLVVDINDFIDKLTAVKPHVVGSKKNVEEGTNLQSPNELKLYKQYTLCINCLLCYAACPQYGRTKAFVGPAALTLAHRYNKDSRDNGQNQRMDVTGSREGVWECTFAGLCSKVCPKKVDPGSAIQQMKLATTINHFRGIFIKEEQQ